MVSRCATQSVCTKKKKKKCIWLLIEGTRCFWSLDCLVLHGAFLSKMFERFTTLTETRDTVRFELRTLCIHRTLSKTLTNGTKAVEVPLQP